MVTEFVLERHYGVGGGSKWAIWGTFVPSFPDLITHRYSMSNLSVSGLKHCVRSAPWFCHKHEHFLR